MAGTPDLRERLARIDRARAETQKIAAEQRKLAAEADKFDRERWLILVGGVAGFFAGLVAMAKTLGKAA